MGKNVSLALNQFVAAPAAPSISNVGTPGGASYGYGIVARVLYADGTTQLTAVSATGSTATGNATLNGSNYNQVNWSALSLPPNASVTYDVYRISGGATQGKIGNTATTSFNDTGLAGDASTAPATNATGIGKPTAFDGTQLENYTFQLSGQGNAFSATVLIEASNDNVEWNQVASLSAGAKTAAVSAQTWSAFRTHMTVYSSGFTTNGLQTMGCFMAAH